MIIGLYPYGIKTLSEGIQVSYGASRRILTKTYISDMFVTDLQLSALEVLQLNRGVKNYDTLSVTMEYVPVVSSSPSQQSSPSSPLSSSPSHKLSSSSPSSSLPKSCEFKTHLVKSSPFVTVSVSFFLIIIILKAD